MTWCLSLWPSKVESLTLKSEGFHPILFIKMYDHLRRYAAYTPMQALKMAWGLFMRKKGKLIGGS